MAPQRYPLLHFDSPDHEIPARFEIDPASVAPYIPTPQSAVEAALALAGVTSGDVVLDLGCGDGRVLITAGERGARGVGIELDPNLVAVCRKTASRKGVADRVEFRSEDILTSEWPPASVVFLFLRAGTLRQLRPRLERELLPGTRVVVYKYEMDGWTPVAVEAAVDRYAETIRLYRSVPAGSRGAPGDESSEHRAAQGSTCSDTAPQAR